MDMYFRSYRRISDVPALFVGVVLLDGDIIATSLPTRDLTGPDGAIQRAGEVQRLVTGKDTLHA